MFTYMTCISNFVHILRDGPFSEFTRCGFITRVGISWIINPLKLSMKLRPFRSSNMLGCVVGSSFICVDFTIFGLCKLYRLVCLFNGRTELPVGGVCYTEIVEDCKYCLANLKGNGLLKTFKTTYLQPFK